ncbi:MAG TPA: hemerythrin domain-containing protein, partial [Methanomicrobiales archaeon]|nr:hemerythrin domain-containing protein [Methanomicrobiales archaeon]
MGPNLLELIEADHNRVREDLKEILSKGATAPPESVDALSPGIEVNETIRQFEALSRELVGVIQGVENVLYPRVLSDLPDRMEEAKRDHNAILILLQEL